MLHKKQALHTMSKFRHFNEALTFVTCSVSLHRAIAAERCLVEAVLQKASAPLLQVKYFYL
jgi:hypothetical protein